MTYPRDIQSAVSDDEAAELEQLATGKRVIEFGTWLGFSAVVMARVAERVVAVDWHHGDEHAGVAETLAPYIGNLSRHGLRDTVLTIVGQFPDVAPTLAHDYFDVGFLDGRHDFASVQRDLALITGLLDRPGCILACHDYDRFEITPAIQAWHEAHPEWVRVRLVGSLYVMGRS